MVPAASHIKFDTKTSHSRLRASVATNVWRAIRALSYRCITDVAQNSSQAVLHSNRISILARAGSCLQGTIHQLTFHQKNGLALARKMCLAPEAPLKALHNNYKTELDCLDDFCSCILDGGGFSMLGLWPLAVYIVRLTRPFMCDGKLHTIAHVYTSPKSRWQKCELCWCGSCNNLRRCKPVPRCS